MLGFTLAVSLVTALVFGLAPALRASRPDIVGELKQRGGPAIGGNRPLNLRSLLVAGQVALSLVALVGAGLFVKSLGNAQRIDLGFDHEKLAVLTVDLGAQGYGEEQARAFQRRMLERAATLPGVERATLASGIPLAQGGFMRTVFPEGTDSSDRKNGKLVQLNTVEPGYFETLGIALVRGRDFAPSDHPDSPRVVVVNETMARQFWPEQEALGKRFKFFGQDWWNEVVGIAQKRQVQLPRRKPAAAHLPLTHADVRAGGEPAPARGGRPGDGARFGAAGGPGAGPGAADHERLHLRRDPAASRCGPRAWEPGCWRCSACSRWCWR